MVQSVLYDVALEHVLDRGLGQLRSGVRAWEPRRLCRRGRLRPFKFPKWETFLRARAHHVAEVRADVADGHCLLAEIHDDEVSTEVPPDLRGDPDGACAVVSGRDGDAGLENLAGHAVLRLDIRVEQDTEPRAVPVVQDLGAGVL